ncbi:hypothetical protein JX265_007020 [Neoarthrinium moseri]|uniref:2EXR domain-containing protein n=1 Tax=Neoarthrinium moseri TaxID=1658444 RepID=A0A9Q0ANU5_9PEZI|nr:hypothetical protein JX266_009177 [Neoarthrinium moseri]KAI1868197.1 hypothetical protein JX265_007020 [Neoarthrinium moseri]
MLFQCRGKKRPGFPFDDLPHELKELIWLYALPDEVPEMATYPAGLRPILPLGPRPDDEAECLVIHTAYPVLMHVCREWRDFAARRTMFRYSQVAGMEVPTRPFRPDLDVLYLPGRDADPIWFDDGRRGSLTRHVAMQAPAFLDHGARSLALMTYFRRLESLAIVLPSSAGHHRLADTFAAPTRRCRLVPIGRSALEDLGVLSVAQDRGPSRAPTVACASALLQWVKVVVQRTGQYLRATQERNPTLLGEEQEQEQTASPLSMPFETSAQTFVEYRYRNGKAEWVERQGGEEEYG